MAVQAQQLPMDFHPRIRSNVLDQQQQFGIGTTAPYGGYGDLAGAGASAVPAQILNAVFSEPMSELTCNAPASRKRTREEEPMLQQQLPSLPADVGVQGLIRLYHQQQGPVKFNPAMVKTILPGFPADNSRLAHSAMTSTSGRTPAAAASSSPSPPASLSPLVQEMASLFNQKNAEIDALIRLHTENLRTGLEQASKRHCRAMVSALGQHAQRRLNEKQLELNAANRRGTELEERARQVAAESQIWFNIAKNNEAMVAKLRTSLEQALLQTSIRCGGGANEEYGDTDGSASPADDAQSCCFDEGQGRSGHPAAAGAEEGMKRGCCKRCREREVSVLVLPCRHLCLCKDCGAMSDTCPVCHTTKTASFQVLFS